ncbi:hypothetical protein PENTCL1PPCAC_2529 [Pristionchus entomophagus]|uniref:Membrane transporter n=1 Tax=Pristionchus entomophagus TaxID=358040 RepID=A0AAV5SG13_9BILA|nr:hypothetical protein PENTCL1PPCAC_2529 [Pristionchus entomophagus]
MGAPVMSLTNQLLLTVCLREDRTSAISMVSLITSFTTLPAEQIIGKISDAIRGDSELFHDRFISLKALFANWTTFLAAGLVYFLMVFFYPLDESRARNEEDEEKSEKRHLLTSYENH